jgi:hypothetical protein
MPRLPQRPGGKCQNGQKEIPESAGLELGEHRSHSDAGSRVGKKTEYAAESEFMKRYGNFSSYMVTTESPST